jgi:hypothetical protein
LTSGNLSNNFPSSPAVGDEYRFCTTQRADAFLKGVIREFHGRYLLTLSLYTLYTRSFVWEDRIIFSHEDIDDAAEDITRRLLIVLSGNQPAAIAINAEPAETLVLINRSFAGRGSTDVLEMPPGEIIITASAPNHESLTIETTLLPDELTVVNLNLNPIRFSDVNINTNSYGRIYLGALYVGDIPLTLRLPLNHLEYIEIETIDERKGTIVFQTPDTADISQSLYVRSVRPLPEGRVEKVRNRFYWAWGGTWITGIAAWIAHYSYMEADRAVRLDHAQTNTINEDFYNRYLNMFYVRNGALIAASVVGSYMVFCMFRYILTSNRGSIRVTPGRN